MSLEQTQQVKQEGKLGFDKINTDVTTITPATVSTTQHGDGNRMDRNLVSVTTPETMRVSKTTAKKTGGPSSKSIKIERVNIGFRLSFSIPFSGIMPTSSGSNC